MDTTFELWDTETGNIVGSFATADESLALARTLLAAYGRDYANDLALSRRVGDGPAKVVARGEPLAVLAEQRADAGTMAIASD